MKTKNYFLNAAVALMLVLTVGFSFYGSDNRNTGSIDREKTEFADAGYWIDEVVITGNSAVSDEELLKDKGYYIDPVVVTFDADKAMLADKGYYIEPVVVTYDRDKAMFADKGYYIEPVIVTYHPEVPELLYASR
ncbi:MAG: hypothetical protein JW973_17360 [Bacteroidales bacterium]|nr:hypothetical protein [Bacteroidales bacterium]